MTPDIKRYPNYHVTRDGHVYRIDTGREMPQRPNHKGYMRVTLYKTGNVKQRFRVARLVALAWIPNPRKYPQVNHKDLCKTNDHVDNLEWVTARQNARHAVKNQTKRCPNCEKAVLLSLFYKNRTRSDGRGSWCAECTRKLVSTYPKIIKPPRVYVRKTVTNSGAFKRCPHCRTTKEIKFFAKSKNRPDGHSGWCKLCLKRNTRDWRDSKHVRRQ